MNIQEFLRYRTNVDVLLYILKHQNNTCSKISFNLKISYSYTGVIVNYLEKAKILNKETHGRKNILSLTKRGKRIAGLLNELELELYNLKGGES